MSRIAPSKVPASYAKFNEFSVQKSANRHRISYSAFCSSCSAQLK